MLNSVNCHNIIGFGEGLNNTNEANNLTSRNPYSTTHSKTRKTGKTRSERDFESKSKMIVKSRDSSENIQSIFTRSNSKTRSKSSSNTDLNATLGTHVPAAVNIQTPPGTCQTPDNNSQRLPKVTPAIHLDPQAPLFIYMKCILNCLHLVYQVFVYNHASLIRGSPIL